MLTVAEGALLLKKTIEVMMLNTKKKIPENTIAQPLPVILSFVSLFN